MLVSLLEGDERCRREGWKGRLEDFCFFYGYRSMERWREVIWLDLKDDFVKGRRWMDGGWKMKKRYYRENGKNLRDI